MTPFSLVFLQDLPALTAVFQPRKLIANTYFETDSQALLLNVKRKVAAQQDNANTQLKRHGAQYKKLYDSKVHTRRGSIPNRWILVDKPPLSGSRNKSDEMATNNCKKLQTQKPAPF